MRAFRTTIVALFALGMMGTKADAQFAYRIDGFQQFYTAIDGGFNAGFDATVLFWNANSYADPDIVLFNLIRVRMPQRVRDFCDTYNPSTTYGLHCFLSWRGFGTRGNVQTGDIPVGDSRWIYEPNFMGNTCQGDYCFDYGLTINNHGILGCQAHAPFVSFYWARTCAEDGYDGTMSMNMRFSYTSPDASIPVLEFSESDLYATGANYVDTHGPNVFVHATPEPASWLLMLTGLTLVAAIAGKKAFLLA